MTRQILTNCCGKHIGMVADPSRWTSEKSHFQHVCFHCSPMGGVRDLFAQAGGVPAVGVRVVDCWQWCSGHYNHQSFLLFFPFFPPVFPFLFFFSVATFSLRRSARIKKLILRKLLRMPKNLGVDTFPDPVGLFGAPWRPFWILEVLQEGMIESKSLFYGSCAGVQ